MIIKQSDFICSAVYHTKFPPEDRFEVAFVGRSNVGKSSLINTLTNRKKLVKVSGIPGKTRLINFFIINGQYSFVDLPGYGYAKVSKSEKEKWGSMIEDYLTHRNQLEKVILLLDCRRKPTEDDIMMYNWIVHYNLQCILVTTKVDKVTKNELQKNLKVIRETLKLNGDQTIYKFSALKRTGIEEIIEGIFKGVEEE